jgi:ubiquinone/menaquinone biosynthesis C-methylase UbiE
MSPRAVPFATSFVETRAFARSQRGSRSNRRCGGGVGSSFSSSLSLPTTSSLASDAASGTRRRSGRRREGVVVASSSSSSSSFSPFQTKLGAMVYDSGYRQLFQLLGYPGCESEARELVSILGNVKKNGAGEKNNLLDVSCGPGIVTKSVIESNAFAKVTALDYFESMCERARETFERECTNRNYDVVRGDVGDLRFEDETFEKVSSTAGMHCWPDPVKGMKEIKRVLKPSEKSDGEDWGVLFSTVVLPNKGDKTKETYSWETNKPFLDREAVLDIVRESGFDECEVVREDKAYILVKARYFRS